MAITEELYPVFQLYVDQLQASGRAVRSVRNTRKAAVVFQRWLAENGLTVESVNPDQVKRFLAGRVPRAGGIESGVASALT